MTEALEWTKETTDFSMGLAFGGMFVEELRAAL